MKIAVALSGGVDSTAAALRLRRDGHQVLGLTMRLCPDLSALEPPGRPSENRPDPPPHGCSWCTDPCACQEGPTVARELGIPHEVLDLRSEFERRVISPFLDRFADGLTPNPCALCNREIKFGLLREAALALGAQALATGHYVRMEQSNGHFRLLRGLDRGRDQSYFLALVPRARFRSVCFPLGEAYKSDVAREVAAAGVRPHDVPTSNEICFLQDRSYAAFVRSRKPAAFRPGEIVDEQGKILGEHQGLPAYTIGQRRGLGVAAPEPLYVLRLEARANRVVVGPDASLWLRSARLRHLQWLQEPPRPGAPVEAQIRYRQTAVPARLEPDGDGGARLEFARPVRAVTPGQVAALYHQQNLLGGGLIAASEA